MDNKLLNEQRINLKELANRLDRLNQINKFENNNHNQVKSISAKENNNDFSYFVYSKEEHWDILNNSYKKLYYPLDEKRNKLKQYQDLLIYYFIINNIKKGSRILEIGGANSRIIQRLSKDYEFWNLDKFEGIGGGTKEIKIKEGILIKDYIGNFNKQLKPNYFDFVFSISVLEHIPNKNNNYRNTLNEINLLLKNGGYSVHCIDSMIKNNIPNLNPIVTFLLKNEKILFNFINFEDYIKKLNVDNIFNMDYKPLLNSQWRLMLRKKENNEKKNLYSVNLFWQKS